MNKNTRKEKEGKRETKGTNPKRWMLCNIFLQTERPTSQLTVQHSVQ